VVVVHVSPASPDEAILIAPVSPAVHTTQTALPEAATTG
jgi:hypothetical protein